MHDEGQLTDTEREQRAETPPPDAAPSPPLRVHIRILDDGSVVFGDLDRRLAEVAAVLGGEAQGSTCTLPASSPAAVTPPEPST